MIEVAAFLTAGAAIAQAYFQWKGQQQRPAPPVPGPEYPKAERRQP